jgi:hypothetical protein
MSITFSPPSWVSLSHLNAPQGASLPPVDSQVATVPKKKTLGGAFKANDQFTSEASKHLIEQIRSEFAPLLAKSPSKELVIIRGLPFTQVKDQERAEKFMTDLFDALELVPKTPDRVDGGRPISLVTPEKGKETSYSAKNSTRPLTYHTDFASFNAPPPFQSLLCLQGHPDAKTTFLHSNTVKQRLKPSVLQSLNQPAFHFAYSEKPLKYSDAAFSVVDTHKGSIRYNPFVKATTQEGEAAFKTFFDTVENTAPDATVTLSPGDLVLWNNHSLIHGRTPFTPKFDSQSTNRLLLRAHLYRKNALPLEPEPHAK